jgi:hypothetical protein
MLMSSAENNLINRLLDNKLFDGGRNLVSHLKRGKVAACIQLQHGEPRMIRCECLLCSEVGRILRLSIQMQNRLSGKTSDARQAFTFCLTALLSSPRYLSCISPPNACVSLAAESVCRERLRASMVIGDGSGEWLCWPGRYTANIACKTLSTSAGVSSSKTPRCLINRSLATALSGVPRGVDDPIGPGRVIGG